MRAVLICLLLAGCASAPIGPKEVKIPVAEPCIDLSDKPERPELTFEKLPWVDDATAAKRVLADLYALDVYSVRLEILIAGCPTK